MSAKTSVFIATSLDGFIARPDGNLDWLDKASSTVPAGEDCGYSEFMSTVDVLILGRKTYEKVRTFGDWPYGDTKVVVLSQNPVAFPPEVPRCVTHSSEGPRELHQRLSSQGANHLYVDGANTIQRFLRSGLVDEMIITVIPVLIGEGIPLFGRLEKDIPLIRLSTKTFDGGFVQSRYAVENETSPKSEVR